MQLKHLKSTNKINAFVVIFKGNDGLMMMGTTEYVESDYPNRNYPIFNQWDGVTRTPAGFFFTLDNSNEVIEYFVKGPVATASELYGCITLEVEVPPYNPDDTGPTIEWAERVFNAALASLTLEKETK